ncbi:MAG: HD-GYP domain-containing protein [Bacillota bacterium]
MDDHRKLELQLAGVNDAKQIAKTINVLDTLVVKINPHVAKHQRQVADLATKIANKLQYQSEMVNKIKLAALVHDIGKIMVPLEYQTLPPDKLDTKVFDIIKEHPRIGYEIINEIKFSWSISQLILQHHERLDGSGYPQGLKGREILIGAKIIAVADVVEAISSHRVYRPALSLEAALDEIQNNSGQLYDKRAVESCLELFNQEDYTFN